MNYLSHCTNCTVVNNTVFLLILQHAFVMSDLSSRIARELLEKAYSSHATYVDPSEIEEEVKYNIVK